jgi:quercetin dioxygenase-like cupin family protein
MANLLPSPSSIPSDDSSRRAILVDPEDPNLPHVGIGTGTYTVLIGGTDTRGRYALIDMLVPPSGGPPPHRHDFEEMFHVLEGELEVTFRGERLSLKAGQSLNIPANAPHGFRVVSDIPARFLCLCLPAGQEEFFLEVGDRLPSRTTAPPVLTSEAAAQRRDLALSLAGRYHSEFLPPPGR